MKPPYRSLSCALALAATAFAAPAAELLTPRTWDGMELDVTLVSPAEKIFQGDPFDVGLVVDSSRKTGDFSAFTTALTFSKTVVFTAATRWSFDFATDDEFFNDPLTQEMLPLHHEGTVGDAFARLTEGADHWRIDLVDPFWSLLGSGGFTWLDGDFHDTVTWRLTDVFIDGNTDYRVVLDEHGIVGAAAFDVAVLVVDPPRPIERPVPEPPAGALSLAGLGALGAFGWLGRRRRQGA